MITHIQGKLVEKNLTDVVIDCNGVGYFLNISLHTYSQIPEGDFLKLYTYMQVKEDSHSLFGFSSVAEREIFKLLTSLTPKQVREGIALGDVALIQSIKGIGAKTAARVILDLKDKVLKVYDLDELSTVKNNTNKDEALSALEVLGFVRKQAERVVDKVVVTQPDASVEVIIKQALKNL